MNDRAHIDILGIIYSADNVVSVWNNTPGHSGYHRLWILHIMHV